MLELYGVLRARPSLNLCASANRWCTSHVPWAPTPVSHLAGVLQRDWLQPLPISKLLLASDLPRTSRRLWHKACAGVEPAALRELALQLEVARAPLCRRSRSPFSVEAMTLTPFLVAFLAG